MTPSRARRADTRARAACPPRGRPLPSSFRGASGRVEAAAGVGPTDDASLRRADEDTLEARAEAEADADEHDDHDHDDDEASAVTTEHGSALARFALAAVGSWGGCCVEFDADGVARDIPLRYVHGVGRVPAANMPFRETELDWMTKCETSATGTVWRFAARHARDRQRGRDLLPRGAEWGEHVAFVEDDPLYALRGANEDKTIPPDGKLLRRRAGVAVRSRRRRRRASLLVAPG